MNSGSNFRLHGRGVRAKVVSRSSLAVLGREALVAAAIVALPCAGVAAQAPKTFFACYVPLTGTVYRIKEADTPQECGTSTKKGATITHVEFKWTDGGGALRPTDAAGGDLSGVLGSPTVAKLLGRALANSPPGNGQVLTWNQALNAWEPKTPSTGGVADHGSLTGLTDDDHPQYLLTEGARSSTNGFALTGTLNVGAIPVTGQGVRLMWYPAKAAFRAGFHYDQWNDVSIGLYSVAMGYQALASGIGSAAFGSGQASGNYATAAGFGWANGLYSFAGGFGAASGVGSVGLGLHTLATGDQSTALGSYASTEGRMGAFVYGDASSSSQVKALTNNQFVVRAGRFWFGNDNNVTATIGRFIETSTGAYLSSGGTWTNSSDSAKKTDFREIDGDSVLAKLASMPVRTWRYRDEDSTVRHIGPTAQAFRTAFSLGDSDKAIATVDADGVSLAGIQALVRRTDRLAGENQALRRTNGELQSQVGALEDRVRQLETRVAQLADRFGDVDAASVRRGRGRQ